jgi:hypothetical protein
VPCGAGPCMHHQVPTLHLQHDPHHAKRVDDWHSAISTGLDLPHAQVACAMHTCDDISQDLWQHNR